MKPGRRRCQCRWGKSQLTSVLGRRFELSTPEIFFMRLGRWIWWTKGIHLKRLVLMICWTKLLIYGSAPETVWVCYPLGVPCETFWRARGWSRWAWDTCPHTWGARIHIQEHTNQKVRMIHCSETKAKITNSAQRGGNQGTRNGQQY